MLWVFKLNIDFLDFDAHGSFILKKVRELTSPC
jgi:hypothetical protein